MKKITMIGIVVISIAVLSFLFLAPVLYWTSVPPPIPPAYARTPGLQLPIYRSLGCAIFGYGDLFSPGGVTLGGVYYPAFVFSFGCKIPYQVHF